MLRLAGDAAWPPLNRPRRRGPSPRCRDRGRRASATVRSALEATQGRPLRTRWPLASRRARPRPGRTRTTSATASSRRPRRGSSPPRLNASKRPSHPSTDHERAGAVPIGQHPRRRLRRRHDVLGAGRLDADAGQLLHHRVGWSGGVVGDEGQVHPQLTGPGEVCGRARARRPRRRRRPRPGRTSPGRTRRPVVADTIRAPALPSTLLAAAPYDAPMDARAPVAPPYVAGPFRLFPFRGMMFAPQPRGRPRVGPRLRPPLSGGRGTPDPAGRSVGTCTATTNPRSTCTSTPPAG